MFYIYDKYCSVLEPKRAKGDYSQTSRPNFGLSDPFKIESEISESIFSATAPITQPTDGTPIGCLAGD